MKLLLASTSPYRKELLSRLEFPFEATAPAYEEETPQGLSPMEAARVHALGKAQSLAARFPEHIIIGSDQVAELDGEMLGKPGTVENAVGQLARMSGRTVAFHTGLALVWPGGVECAVETFRVTLKSLTPAQIIAYVERERPVDCAGSFKVEGLGIVLMEKLEGEDYTSLIGLPLIRLCDLLKKCGVDVLLDSPGRGGCRTIG